MNLCIEKMKPSASVQLMAMAKKMKQEDPEIIDLAGGEPDFSTPKKISEAAIQSLLDGNTHYAVGPGLPALREAIQKKLERENGIICDRDHIMITPGGKNAVFLAMQALLNPGDEVMILTPAWVSYEPIVLAAHAEPVMVSLDCKTDYAITEEKLESGVSEKTRLLVINYPNNPTGRILHTEEADALEAFLLRHPQIYLLSDEIYEAIVFDGKRSISMGARKAIYDRVITINGFSKSVAMTGWRLGYLAAADPVYSAIYKLYQHSLTCANTFLQEGAILAFSCETEIEQMRCIYEARRNLLVNELNQIRGVSFREPEGAFYAWVQFSVPGKTASEMSEYLLKHARVVGVPGTAYGETEACCIRFSFAADTEELRKAAERIRIAMEDLWRSME